jgi:hypothetical protein
MRLTQIAVPTALALTALTQSASAATTPSQVRFAISPSASDPVWKTPGVKFEKAAECKVISASSRTPAFPAPSEVLRTHSAKAPLFNPGQPTPNGSYSTAPDDGFNTLFVPIEFPANLNSHIGCRGLILANGIPVNLGVRTGLVAKTMAQLGGTGPMTVSPQLDRTALANVPKVLRQGKIELKGQKVGGGPGIAQWYDFEADKIHSGGYDFGSPAGSDIRIFPGTASDQIVSVQFNAGKLAATAIPWPPAGDKSFGHAKCKELNLVAGGQKVAGTVARAAGYYCFRTSEGHLGALSLESEDNDTSSSVGGQSMSPISYVKFQYVLWM